jgi:hypothetical protein
MERRGMSETATLFEQHVRDLEAAIVFLGEDSPVDALLTQRNAVDSIKVAVKGLDELMGQKMLEWLRKNGNIDAGPVKYILSRSKSEKCQKVAETVNAVYKAAQGDESKLVECLVAQPFKPAATRKTIGEEQYAQLFESTVSEKVEVKRINTEFSK